MIPLSDPRLTYLELKPELDEAVSRVLKSGRYVQGEEVEAFESEYSVFSGVRHAIAVNSGTSALHLSLLAAGVGPGDEVITVPMTFGATVASIIYTGARPVFVDIEPKYYTLDPRRLPDAITQRTRAIIPVHLYGQPADMDPIRAIAKAHNVTVIEDACQAHGAAYKERPVGSLGDLACFSFYPSKNLGAFGEGGLVLTSDPDLADRVRCLRNWGTMDSGRHVSPGFNYRMDEIQASLLRVKLRHLSTWNTDRRALAARYLSLLSDGRGTLPSERGDSYHVYHLFSLRHPDRDRLRTHLTEKGIATGIHYAPALHLSPACRDYGYVVGTFPESEALAQEELSLPLYPGLTETSLSLIADTVRSFDTITMDI